MFSLPPPFVRTRLPPMLTPLSPFVCVDRSNNAKFITFFATLYCALVLGVNLFGFLHDLVQISFLAVMRIASACLIVLNLFFPLALYKSLLADTKYWRGLGRFNKRPFRISVAARQSSRTMNKSSESGNSGQDVSPPDSSSVDNRHSSMDSQMNEVGPVSMSVASTNMQSMMGSHQDILIEFFHLQVGTKIGRGSTAMVYKGMYKKMEVAIKVFSPPEILEEDVNRWVPCCPE